METSKEFKVAGLRDTGEGSAGQVGTICAREFGLYPVGIWSNDDRFGNQIAVFHPNHTLGGEIWQATLPSLSISSPYYMGIITSTPDGY